MTAPGQDNPAGDQQLRELACEHLDQFEQVQAAARQQDLAAARRRAVLLVASAPVPPAGWLLARGPWFALAGSAATVACAVLLWVGAVSQPQFAWTDAQAGPGRSMQDDVPMDMHADMHADMQQNLMLLLGAEDAAVASELELLEELEFMAWMELQAETADPAAGTDSNQV